MQWVCKHELAHRHSGVDGGGTQEILLLIAELFAPDRFTEQGNHCLQYPSITTLAFKLGSYTGGLAKPHTSQNKTKSNEPGNGNGRKEVYICMWRV